jgi:hypothetical protein
MNRMCLNSLPTVTYRTLWFILSSIPAYVFDPSRLAALEGYSILDTAPEAGFDDIFQLVRGRRRRDRPQRHRRGGPAERFEISGPSLTIGPRATLSLSLLLHDLSTNALKYGALSVENGEVSISWRVDEASDEVVLSWREYGPPAVAPARRGFGSRLIGMGLVGTGGVELRYLETGLEGAFRAPLREIQRT